MTWQNTSDKNKDTYSANNDGKLSGKVGHVLSREWIQASVVNNNVLKLTASSQKARAGQFVYRGGFVQGTSTPPPPPPPPPPQNRTITHTIVVYSDGSITIDGNPYP